MKNEAIAGGTCTARLAAVGLGALLLAGCSMGNMFGGGPDNSQALANTSATPAEIAQNQPSSQPAIATQCPAIKVIPGGQAIFNFGSSRTRNAQDLHYQAVIDKQTRNCVVSTGLITVNMGAEGRVILGPKGTETLVNVPLRFAVERNGTAVFSEKYLIPVKIVPPATSASFSKVLNNVAIPYLGGENIVIYVGFDTGKK